MEYTAKTERVFEENNRKVTIRLIKTTSILALTLILCGSLLDFFGYPEHQGTFFMLRILCGVCCIATYFAIDLPFFQRFYRLFTLIIPLIPAAFISLMIYISGDPASPYYAGLCICIVGLGFMFGWSTRESLLAVVIVLLMYTCASFPALLQESNGRVIGTFVNNCIFILINGALIAMGCSTHFQMRRNEFLSSFQLNEKHKELEESNAQLREMDRLKNDFLANISHELRTPLTLLLAPLETMRRKVTDGDQATVIKTMHTQALRLLKLINDLLDVAKLESGQMAVKPENIDAHAFFKQMAANVEALASQRNITVSHSVAHDLKNFQADSDKMEKVFLNLLFNAIKFTPDEGAVTIQAKVQERYLIVDIVDTGIGIPEDRLPFIFDRFWQADTSTKKKHAGTGIGLALVKELTEAHDGSVSVSSVVGKGTQFTIKIPLLELKEASAPTDKETNETDEWVNQLYRKADRSPALSTSVAPTESTTDPSPNQTATPIALPEINPESLKLVIADDEPGMRAFLKDEMENQFEIFEASNGTEAVRQTTEHLPDLLLLDYMMPEKDGFEVCHELRSQAETQMVPIMLLTAKADEEARLSGLAAGANDVLIKPFSLTEFHTRARNLVNAHRLQKAILAKKDELQEALDQLKEAEGQLVQSEKMASLGQMSAGVIHEINNPLNFTNSAIFILKKKGRKLPEKDRESFLELVSDIQEGLDRVSTIVSDLREFSHPDSGELSNVDICHVVEMARRFMSKELRDAGVELVVDMPDTAMIKGNQNKLVQVLVNLITNAVHALRDAETASPTVTVSFANNDNKDYVLTVRDNGKGIAEEHRNKLFDPFFTTKKVGEGTGLGLSICYRIIQEHRGTIDVESTIGEYTQFNMAFPKAA